jgi:uncharacterized membrane protein YgdD (TMEM256/DUF423 family)
VSPRGTAASGAIHAFIAVLAGAFGAHAMSGRDPHVVEIFQTAAHYQLMHGLGLLAIAWLADRGTRGTRGAGMLMNLGIVCFSGGIYLYALTGEKAFAMAAPIGGLSLLLAWALLAWGILATRPTR